MINWFNQNIREDLYSDPNITNEMKNLRLMANLEVHIGFKFQYLFGVMIICLLLRVSLILQFNESIGPLIKIVAKMGMDFLNFFILYCILAIMFAIVGNLNFMQHLTEYEGFFRSVLTVVDASLGNFDMHVFNTIKNDLTLLVIGEVYIIIMVLAFNILLLNLIIAILANTYNIFDTRSNGLYLSKILATRDELTYDESYGAFLSSMPPINAV